MLVIDEACDDTLYPPLISEMWLKFIIFHICLQSAVKNIHGNNDLVYDALCDFGKRLPGLIHIIATYPGIPSGVCAKKCQNLPECLSFDFTVIGEATTCQLLNSRRHSACNSSIETKHFVVVSIGHDVISLKKLGNF